MTRHQHAYPADEPAHYRMRYLGALGVNWSNRLGGMVIVRMAQEGQTPVVQLTGQLTDQAAVLGVINTLYDLGLCLLSVERVESEEHSEETRVLDAKDDPGKTNGS